MAPAKPALEQSVRHLTEEACRSSNFPFELIPGTEGLGFEL
jgi:hypothetical protein